MMNRKNLIGTLTAWCLLAANGWAQNVVLSPANGEKDVCIDTHLSLTFDSDVTVGKKGKVKLWDAETGKLVDVLDLSIPAGPTESQPNNPDAIYTPTPYLYKEGPRATNRNTVPGTPSGVNKWDKSRYQWNIIGGFSDAFHFYPIITKGRKATIYLHNNMLDYGKEYYVTIDKGVIDLKALYAQKSAEIAGQSAQSVLSQRVEEDKRIQAGGAGAADGKGASA